MKPSAFKRNHTALQNFLIFSTFAGHYCPPGSGSGSEFRIRIRIHWPDWIASRFYLGHDVGLLAAVEVSVRHARHAGLRVRLPRPHSRGPLGDLNRIKNYIPVLRTVRREDTVQHTVPGLEQVMWIRTGFNTDPDPAFYLNAEPDPGN